MPAIQLNQNDATDLFIADAWKRVADTGLTEHPAGHTLRTLLVTGTIVLPRAELENTKAFFAECDGSAKALTFEE